MTSLDSFKCARTLKVGKKTYAYYSLPAAEKAGLKGISRLPFSMKVLLENLLRHEDGRTITKQDIQAVAQWLKTKTSDREIAFRPARVLMQDFTGVPAVVDLAAMRDAMKNLGGDPKKINPLVPVDLVIDHSVIINFFGNNSAFKKNVDEEYKQNQERYQFLKWAQSSFENFRVVPPGTGICHQVNLEYLSQTVWTAKGKIKIDGKDVTAEIAYPDTLVGTDSHTTMVNGLAVLGWGVGGIEAEAAMLGQPYSMLLPEVIGVKLTGKLKEGVTATDLVLTVTQMLRKRGVVGKFVEFFGPGLANLSLADRATIGNMAPEYGATCGFFPIDGETITLSARHRRGPKRASRWSRPTPRRRACSAPRTRPTRCSPTCSSSISPASSPRSPVRSVRRIACCSRMSAPASRPRWTRNSTRPPSSTKRVPVEGRNHDLGHGDVVIAAITSCTNTSNPSVMIGAGLLARKAAQEGPEGQAVGEDLARAGLAGGRRLSRQIRPAEGSRRARLQSRRLRLHHLHRQFRSAAGGNLRRRSTTNDLVAAAVLSGNRNFEGRVNADVRANYLASPPLVVAYAIAGSMQVDLTKTPIGVDKKGKKVFLKDIWPSNREINVGHARSASPRPCSPSKYANVFKGDANWRKISVKGGLTYAWDSKSTYVQNPPYFTDMQPRAGAGRRYRRGARARPVPQLDHHRPHFAGRLDQGHFARRAISGRAQGASPRDFNQYGTRRGNHEVMMRGTFANIRIKNQMVPGVEGGVTIHYPDRAADADLRRGHALQERECAARRLRRQGIRHRLVARLGRQGHDPARRARRGRAIFRAHSPLQPDRHGRGAAGVRGRHDLADTRAEGQRDRSRSAACTASSSRARRMMAEIVGADGTLKRVPLICRIDTLDELDYFKNGGILQYVLRHLVAA